MAIAVFGNSSTVPESAPLSTAANIGNMIHGNAPFEMFGNCFFNSAGITLNTNTLEFIRFANQHCTHAILVLANTLQVHSADTGRYENLQKLLDKLKIPIVIFGLGVQATSGGPEENTLDESGIAFMKFLSDKCEVIGIRGETSKKIVERSTGISNLFVTGCPSLFSRPSKLKDLRTTWKESVKQSSGSSFALTNPTNVTENALAHEAIKGEAFWIEPFRKLIHEFHVESVNGNENAKVPFYFKRYLDGASPSLSERQLRDYFASKYRTFRSPQDWYAFNAESVSFTYGTRFHVNMASILSGKPALWYSHDARTDELVDFFHLPNVRLGNDVPIVPADVAEAIDYSPFFEQLPNLFDNFNEYLSLVGLPSVRNMS